jgi:hypothetical protein
VSENGFELARSNGAFETRLDMVSPHVVPRPGRSGAGSNARLDFFAGALRLALALSSFASARAPPARPVGAGGGLAAGADWASSKLPSLSVRGAEASGAVGGGESPPAGKALGSSGVGAGVGSAVPCCAPGFEAVPQAAASMPIAKIDQVL